MLPIEVPTKISTRFIVHAKHFLEDSAERDPHYEDRHEIYGLSKSLLVDDTDGDLCRRICVRRKHGRNCRQGYVLAW